jgi:hypothetical protein
VSYLANPIFLGAYPRVQVHLARPIVRRRRGLGDDMQIDPASGMPLIDMSPSSFAPPTPANLPNPVISGGMATGIVALENWWDSLFPPGTTTSDVIQNAWNTPITPNQMQANIAQENQSCIAAGGSPASCMAYAQKDQAGITDVTSRPGAFPSVTSFISAGTPRISIWVWVALGIGAFAVIRDVL